MTFFIGARWKAPNPSPSGRGSELSRGEGAFAAAALAHDVEQLQRVPEVGGPDSVVVRVDDAIIIAVGPQIGRRAERVPPDGVVLAADAAVVDVVGDAVAVVVAQQIEHRVDDARGRVEEATPCVIIEVLSLVDFGYGARCLNPNPRTSAIVSRLDILSENRPTNRDRSRSRG